MWINKFKIAIAQKDSTAISELLDNLPTFENQNEVEVAKFLMEEAVLLMVSMQEEITVEMKKIRENQKFLKASLSDSQGSFSVKS